MSAEKRKSKSDVDMGGLGKAFHFTRDDLAANRAGYMSRAQQFQIYGITRQLFGWLVNNTFATTVFGKPRSIEAFTGTVRKIQSSRTVVMWRGGSHGGGNNYNEITHDYVIQLTAQDNRDVSFYVTEKQYNAIPSQVEITLYYDPLDEQILSVEPPYKLDD
ncbi:MAG: hypothetical protein AAFR81_14150 [Chloroflexota bacterium]